MLGRKVLYHSRIQQIMFYDDDYEIFDFIMWSSDERFSINFSEPKCYRIMPVEFLKDLQLTEFEGEYFSIPKRCNDWAEYRYGSTWKAPETKKRHFSETCGDIGNAWWLR